MTIERPCRLTSRWRLILVGLTLPTFILTGGCSDAKQGAVAGAGVGALSGLVIGSLTGSAGKGAAIGAVVGGVGGAVIGDQNRRHDAAASGGGTSSDSQSAADRERLALAKFARAWSVSGWELVDGQRKFVSGTSVGAVENNYFLRMEMRISPDDRSAIESVGNLVFGAEPGRGLTMTSRFSTSPYSMSYSGTVSPDGRTFTLYENEHSGGGGGRRIVIRFLTDNEFIADVTDGSGRGYEEQASLRFSGA